MATAAADVHAHVLDDAEHRHVDLFEHLERLARVEQGDVLGRGHDHRARDRDLLAQGELNVTGTGGQVDDQVVEIVPVGIGQQLFQRAGDHRSAPDHRRVFFDQVADRNSLQAITDTRLHGLAVAALGPAAAGEHAGLARTIDVRVEHADLAAFLLKRDGEIGGGGRLADATLTGCDGDDVTDLRQWFSALLHFPRDDFRADFETRFETLGL